MAYGPTGRDRRPRRRLPVRRGPLRRLRLPDRRQHLGGSLRSSGGISDAIADRRPSGIRRTAAGMRCRLVTIRRRIRQARGLSYCSGRACDPYIATNRGSRCDPRRRRRGRVDELVGITVDAHQEMPGIPTPCNETPIGGPLRSSTRWRDGQAQAPVDHVGKKRVAGIVVLLFPANAQSTSSTGQSGRVAGILEGQRRPRGRQVASPLSTSLPVAVAASTMRPRRAADHRRRSQREGNRSAASRSTGRRHRRYCPAMVGESPERAARHGGGPAPVPPAHRRRGRTRRRAGRPRTATIPKCNTAPRSRRAPAELLVLEVGVVHRIVADDHAR